MTNQNIGRTGEDLAAKYLQSKGYQVTSRNFRAKQYGEVDIIAVSPGGKELVFVEVKTRVGDRFGRPEEAVGRGKLHELSKMVDYYFNVNPNLKLSPQIDVVAITLNADYSLNNLEHLENVTI